MWSWLVGDKTAYSIGFIVRVLLKAALLFTLCNGVYMLTNPLSALGNLSLYNAILPPRERLPYGENPAESYSLSLNNLNAMFASHAISREKRQDEYRVLLMGDSATWGWFLPADQTYAAHINAANVRLNDGRQIIAYNLGYPIMSLTKDLMLLDRGLRYEPDLVLWLVSLESLPVDKQTFPPIVQQNGAAVQPLIERYDLNVDSDVFVNLTRTERTLVGQRRELANLLRLQLYGFSWAATGIDQFIPEEIQPTRRDLDADESWNAYDAPTLFTRDDLAFDVLVAGIAHAGDVPLVVINEPMFISDGEHSDIRYNTLYPRWAYDQYRTLLTDLASENNWFYVDAWDTIAPEQFSDSPVHLSPDGAREFSVALIEIIQEASE